MLGHKEKEKEVYYGWFLSSFRTHMKCHLLRKTFPDHPVQIGFSSTPASTTIILYYCIIHTLFTLSVAVTGIYNWLIIYLFVYYLVQYLRSTDTNLLS